MKVGSDLELCIVQGELLRSCHSVLS